MAITTVGGAAAYAEAARRSLDVGGDAAVQGVATGPSFSDFVQDVVGQALQTGQKAEQSSMAAISGKADVTDVVTAVSHAEISLQTVVALRDKMIQAYDEIMKMPI